MNLGRGTYMQTVPPCVSKAMPQVATLSQKAAAAAYNFYKTTKSPVSLNSV